MEVQVFQILEVGGFEDGGAGVFEVVAVAGERAEL